MNKEHNNPFKIVEKMKGDFERRNIKITNIQHDDCFGGSWIIEFILDKLNYKFVWDNRESWLVLAILGEDKKHPKYWEDIHIYRYNKSTRSSEEKKALEKHNIEKMLLSLEEIDNR